MLTSTEVYDKAALDALVANVLILGSDLKMGLNTNIVNPSKTLSLADMLEPTYSGYARQLVEFGPSFRDPSRGISSLAAGLLWQQAATPTPCLIQGYFLIGGTASAVFYGYEPLDQPFQMTDDLDAITIVVQYIQASQAQGFATFLK